MRLNTSRSAVTPRTHEGAIAKHLTPEQESPVSNGLPALGELVL